MTPDELIAVLDEIERLRVEADGIARWIVDQIGYPADVRTSEPPSAPWQQRIEDIWVERDGEPNNPDLNEDIRCFIAEEGGWE